ncbi:MAG: phosphate ABC transporter substrate-binding protein [Burkholderiales bacterium RIFCSPLOWO2_02_FULL_57_36]|nr:MAG: phosphate ABC transporter substrate-binding protein [Burkholderiales bacterium RIFCSPLOWO2_02_FULL_57_36]
MVQQGVLAFLCGLAINVAAAEVVVVVSAKSRITALGADQVANIFLGKTLTYPGGAEAVPLDQPEGAAVRQEFYTKVTHKSSALLKAHWSKLLFTGRGQPPRELTNGDAMKKIIADNPAFIGYMNKSEIDDSVRVVLVP